MDIQLNFIVSSNSPTLGGLNGLNGGESPQQLLFRLLSGEDSSQTSPLVSRIKDIKEKTEYFNKEFKSYIKKIKEGLEELNKDIEQSGENDSIISNLMNDIRNNQYSLSKQLLIVDPLVKKQLDSVTKLSDHVRPPTEELFKKKALDLISKRPIQKVPESKKNTCTICLENTADVIIKRNCFDRSKQSSSPSSSSNTSTTTTTTTTTTNSLPTIPTTPLQTTNTPLANNSTTSVNNSPTSPQTNRSSNTTSSNIQQQQQPTATTTTTRTTTSLRRLPRALGMLFGDTGLGIDQRETSQVQRKTPFCEKAVCHCGPISCKECLLKHYWVSSSNGLKSYSTCVCCRSEFCLKDIHNVEYEIEEKEIDEIEGVLINNGTTTTTTTTTTPSPSIKKRKDANDDTSSRNKKLKSENGDSKKKTTSTTTTPPNKKKSETSLKRSKEFKKKSSSIKTKDSKTLFEDTDSDTCSENEQKDNKNYDDGSDDESDDENSRNNRSSGRVTPFNTFKQLINFWK